MGRGHQYVEAGAVPVHQRDPTPRSVDLVTEHRERQPVAAGRPSRHGQLSEPGHRSEDDVLMAGGQMMPHDLGRGGALRDLGEGDRGAVRAPCGISVEFSLTQRNRVAGSVGGCDGQRPEAARLIGIEGVGLGNPRPEGDLGPIR